MEEILNRNPNHFPVNQIKECGYTVLNLNLAN